MTEKKAKSSLRDLQMIELSILKEIISVCERLNITYYASNGTLLGAVRHGGYIPWDDDIDISFKRKDYELFLAKASCYLPDDLEVKTYKDSEDDAIYTARVVKKNTKLIIRTAEIAREDNIWIDLWALDGMPGNKVINRIHRMRLMVARCLVQISKYDELIHQYRKNRPVYEKMIIRICEITHIGQKINTKKAKARVEKIMKLYSADECKYIINFWSPYKFKEEVLSTWYGQGKELSFEDIHIHVPNEPEKILTKLYGDYMKFPPEDERNKQHCMEIVTI